MNVQNIPIEKIKVSRERFRGATGDMEALAESIVKFGLQVPIVVDENCELIDGFRRYTAHQMNGATEIPAVLKGTVDELLAKELELEINIQREDMTWQERQKAIATLHQIKQERDPSWGQLQTAKVVEVNQREVSEAIQLSKAMEMFPEIAQAKTKAKALNFLKHKVKNILRVQEVKNNKVDYADIEGKILLGDSVDLIKTIPSESVHAVITDPPFGVDYDSRVAGTIGSLTDYQDDRESYERLLSMAPDIYRIIKPNGWLIWFFGISWYERVKTVFRSTGFTVDEVPIIWDRSGGRTFTNRPDRYFSKAYDVAIHAFKGEPALAQQGKPNVIRVNPVEQGDRVALVERPIELYGELIRRLTIPGETVADLFVGSGSCPAAAAALGRDFIGCEKNPERRAIALKKIRAHTPSSSASTKAG